MSLPPDFDDRFQKGEYVGAIYGHGGSVNEPYSTLRLYQSRSVAVPGAHLVNFARWKNAEFDKIVDEMYVTDPNDKPKMMELFHEAMEIWLPELPDIQLVQNYPPHPDEHDLLEELADRGQRLRQRRVLAPDLSDRAVEPASRRLSGRRVRAVSPTSSTERRLSAVFLLIVWLAATLNFFLPRLSGQDPVRTKLLQSAQLGGYVQAGIEEMVKEYDRRFGLDQPLWRQYLTYLRRHGAARLQLLDRQLPAHRHAR